ncbi:thioredoxin domain-containing protein [Actinomadura sp. WMMB 499]|uniref:DsbA family protein n=1 Tax=Actinomadura sp. WMMB 499 TaxID=1219491 RepID=UPI001247AF6C|nr:thioredoxin domain-containing protein [Actinomadura sp. WMMB 499]QFG25969.1 thioredoxin domain-containing protein [Actinomadura sp. WMMB 499]
MADNERSARRRLADERARDAARTKRRRLLLTVLGGVAAAAVVVAVVVMVTGRQDGPDPIAEYDGTLAPATHQRDGSVAMAKQGVNAPVLEIYEDFQCPACRAMEARLGATIKDLAAEGRVKVVYRPFQLFQQDPLMGNSRRAANAAACAPAGKWVAYHDKLFTHQPPEGDEGFTPDELVTWAGEVGITGPQFETCVRGMQKIEQVEDATTAAGRAGVDSTPYLALNGRKLTGDALTPEGLRDAVAGAQGTTPTPTGSASGGMSGNASGAGRDGAGTGTAAMRA